ncbi:hypothetical protein L1987_54422 [Smallanthus sonchifolius]|uniref:Uncharacterized protein n=1 Tax=Smallanthus sonchifolius TaxID=185202 RepID=A0ACB9E6Z1_9ASTR|nr:hypothetical protein L1987_54422 [Smallanthus sonchifolius]
MLNYELISLLSSGSTLCYSDRKTATKNDKDVCHKKTITSLAKTIVGSHFLTGSLDKSAKFWDTRSLTLIKIYVTPLAVNAVVMSPLLNHIQRLRPELCSLSMYHLMKIFLR